MELTDFQLGFVIGAVILLVLGQIWNLNKKWVGQRDAYYKPQKVELKTDKSPADVARLSASARQSLILLRTGVVIAGWLLFEWLVPAWAAEVRNTVLQVFTAIAGFLVNLL